MPTSLSCRRASIRTIKETFSYKSLPQGNSEHSKSIFFPATMHVYEVRPRSDKRGVDVISDALPFGALWYCQPNAISSAIGYAKFFSRSHDAVIRVYDKAGSVIPKMSSK